MSQSLSQLYTHIIYSTKNREPFINNNIKNELHSYIADNLKLLNTPAITIGGTEDHIHVLCRLSKNYSISTIIKKTKIQSSQWIKTKGITNFFWQRGYGAFSVSPSRIEIITNYINNQEEHHKSESFKDEFKFLLQKHNIPIQEKYLWD